MLKKRRIKIKLIKLISNPIQSLIGISSVSFVIWIIPKNGKHKTNIQNGNQAQFELNVKKEISLLLDPRLIGKTIAEITLTIRYKLGLSIFFI